MLPISVLIPTRNSASVLPAHLEALRSWAPEVQEILVVDSFSNDGTPDLVKAGLAHPRLRVLQHPPGLYSSWNFGLQQLTSKYAYVSTVGDTITLKGLEHLFEVAERFRADVVLSQADFVHADGRAVRNKRWPLHDLLEARGTRAPEQAPAPQLFVLASIDVPDGIMGSSASNLYLTKTFKRFPFPTEYGHSGDTAWGIEHAFDAVTAITPGIFSTFLIHPNPGILAEDKKLALSGRLLQLAHDTALSARQRLPDCGITDAMVQVLEGLPNELTALRQAQDRYDAFHRRSWPWVLNPLAWRARMRRNRQRARTFQLKNIARRECGLPCVSPV